MNNQIKSIINETEKTIKLQKEVAYKYLKQSNLLKFNYFLDLASENEARVEELKAIINE